jgi:fructan beta-fructosidase
MKNQHRIKIVILALTSLTMIYACQPEETSIAENVSYNEIHRPQFHFSPKEMWMNDPNGMVFDGKEYHLFYQYNPNDVVWGPMHWGHAVSSDLVHWNHLPVALYPDSLGTIFSGSAVLDEQNTSGLGSEDNPPLVAIYTYHDTLKASAGRNDYQTQGLAFSIDAGRTWEKYKRNPIVHNPGIIDFRDPKVFWYEPAREWLMILAVKDHVEFYSSPNLIDWKKRGEFGQEFGNHGGVWECPDLFPLVVDGEDTRKWVMIVSINPGGPNGGSATQYFVGDFDGVQFTCDSDPANVSWLDYGPDNYAGVTWSNTPDNRRLFLGWMSNWAYANQVPTNPWRSANTIPRELYLARIGGSLHVRSKVVPELKNIISSGKSFPSILLSDSIDLTVGLDFDVSTSILDGVIDADDFGIELSNSIGQRLRVGYSSGENQFFVDRGNAGNDFSEKFNPVSYAPRMASDRKIRFNLVIDVSSIEVFFDDGTTVTTSLFFPDQKFDRLKIFAASKPITVDSLRIRKVSSIWSVNKPE